MAGLYVTPQIDTSAGECITFVNTVQYRYSWTINDFADWSALSGEVPTSPSFSTNDGEELEWQLYFRPRSMSSAFHSTLMLWLTKSSAKRVQVEFKLSLLDGANKTIQSISGKHLFTHDRSGFGWESFIERKRLLEKVKVYDKLIVTCEILAKMQILNQITPTYKTSIVPDSLRSNLFDLLEDEKFNDVTFMIRGQDFPAHKCVLAARSPVFAAMFSHQMKESAENVVAVTDVDSAVFKEFLRYIYTDQVLDLDSMAERLYSVADKYDIKTLKNHCRRTILEKLSLETAGDTLKLAEMHSDRDMKARVLQFLRNRDAVRVTETIGWQEMAASHPKLAQEGLKAMEVGSWKVGKDSSLIKRAGRALLGSLAVFGGSKKKGLSFSRVSEG